jgi:hypothetical protein
VSIFSDLNHLTDITIHKQFASLLGYTLEEIEKYFSEYLDAVEEDSTLSKSEIIEKMKVKYNGYSWDGKTFVNNPFCYKIFSIQNSLTISGLQLVPQPFW